MPLTVMVPTVTQSPRGGIRVLVPPLVPTAPEPADIAGRSARILASPCQGEADAFHASGEGPNSKFRSLRVTLSEAKGPGSSSSAPWSEASPGRVPPPRDCSPLPQGNELGIRLPARPHSHFSSGVNCSALLLPILSGTFYDMANRQHDSFSPDSGKIVRFPHLAK